MCFVSDALISPAVKTALNKSVLRTRLHHHKSIARHAFSFPEYFYPAVRAYSAGQSMLSQRYAFLGHTVSSPIKVRHNVSPAAASALSPPQSFIQFTSSSLFIPISYHFLNIFL